jgi:two-component system response regulator GlrR
MQKLTLYSWPGNVRELENAIEKAVVLSSQDMITPDLLPSVTPDTAGHVKPLTEAKEEFTRNYLKEVLQLTGGNISRAAQIAGRYRADFYKLLKKHGLHPGAAKEEKDTDSAESA